MLLKYLLFNSCNSFNSSNSLKKICKYKIQLFTLCYKVLFMNEKNQQIETTLHDIKSMMERSSRFISLSGWSGISAGICALIGAWFAHGVIGVHNGGIRKYDDFNSD